MTQLSPAPTDLKTLIEKIHIYIAMYCCTTVHFTAVLFTVASIWKLSTDEQRRYSINIYKMDY